MPTEQRNVDELMNKLEKKYNEAKQVVQEWADMQGHDRCWWHPDLFKRLMKIFEINPSRDPALPPLEEFKRGCEQYQKEQYGIKEQRHRKSKDIEKGFGMAKGFSKPFERNKKARDL